MDQTPNTSTEAQEGVTPNVAEDTTALKKALEAERRKARELEKTLKERQQQEEDAKAAKEREELERKGEYDKLRAKDLATIKSIQDELEAMKAKDRKNAIAKSALEAIGALGGIPKALEPHLVSVLEAVPDGDGFKVVSSKDPSKTAHDLVSAWRQDPEWSWAFKGVGASGVGSAPVNHGVSYKSWDQMSLTERSEFFKQHPDQAKQFLGGNKK